MKDFLDQIMNHDEGEYTPLVIIAHDKELAFIDKRRLQIIESSRAVKKKIEEEFKQKMQEEQSKAWKQIEEYAYKNFGVPIDSNLKITDGVLFVEKEKDQSDE